MDKAALGTVDGNGSRRMERGGNERQNATIKNRVPTPK
jgi:hypothetical protein